jgi:uncharacterized lipoprotein YddW (UPF0748 family)
MISGASRRPPRFPHRWLYRIFYFFVAICLILALHEAPAYHPSTLSAKAELRAVWMTNSGATFLNQTTQLDEALHHLATLNFNTLYPAVWNRGYTLYPSQVAKAATGIKSTPWATLPWQDVLKSVAHQAHRQGLAVVPWFEYGLMAPARSNLVKRHPDWITQDRNGHSLTRPHAQPLPKILPAPLQSWIHEWSGMNMVWLNPAHPEVQDFLTDLIGDVVSRYSIEGIQLDDHFAMPIAMGYDPFTIELYRKEHDGLSPPDDPSDPSWMTWRAEKLTALMRRISATVKAKNPNCRISLSPNPPGFAYQEYLQDWPTWAKTHLIDEVVVQVYRPTLNDVETELANPVLLNMQQFLPVSVGLFTGAFPQLRSFESVAEQARTVQVSGYSGVAFFHWGSMLDALKRDSSQSVQKIFQELFPQPSYPVRAA